MSCVMEANRSRKKEIFCPALLMRFRKEAILRFAVRKLLKESQISGDQPGDRKKCGYVYEVLLS